MRSLGAMGVNNNLRLAAMSTDGRFVAIRHQDGIELVDSRLKKRKVISGQFSTFAFVESELWVLAPDTLRREVMGDSTSIKLDSEIGDTISSCDSIGYGGVLLCQTKNGIQKLGEGGTFEPLDSDNAWLSALRLYQLENGALHHQSQTFPVAPLGAPLLITDILDDKAIAVILTTEKTTLALTLQGARVAHKQTFQGIAQQAKVAPNGTAILAFADRLVQIDLRYGKTLNECPAPLEVVDLELSGQGKMVLVAGFSSADAPLSVLHLDIRELFGDQEIPEPDEEGIPSPVPTGATVPVSTSPLPKTLGPFIRPLNEAEDSFLKRLASQCNKEFIVPGPQSLWKFDELPFRPSFLHGIATALSTPSNGLTFFRGPRSWGPHLICQSLLDHYNIEALWISGDAPTNEVELCLAHAWAEGKLPIVLNIDSHQTELATFIRHGRALVGISYEDWTPGIDAIVFHAPVLPHGISLSALKEQQHLFRLQLETTATLQGMSSEINQTTAVSLLLRRMRHQIEPLLDITELRWPSATLERMQSTSRLLARDSQASLAITGPSGCGKTGLVHTLCEKSELQLLHITQTVQFSSVLEHCAQGPFLCLIDRPSLWEPAIFNQFFQAYLLHRPRLAIEENTLSQTPTALRGLFQSIFDVPFPDEETRRSLWTAKEVPEALAQELAVFTLSPRQIHLAVKITGTGPELLTTAQFLSEQ